VSPKQNERARQTFTKSANYAGFIDAASGRFVKPGIVGKEEVKQEKKAGNGGGDGGEKDDPLIAALIQKLPPAGPWPADERVTWFKMAMAFPMTYGQEPEIRITKEAAN
jgi:hypothetical protein